MPSVIVLILEIAGLAGMIWFGSPVMASDGVAPAAPTTPMTRQGGMMGRGHMQGRMQEMMNGRFPPGVKPETLPEPDTPGAKLFVRYCSQCHNLPSPSMHTAEEWPAITARMIDRMKRMAQMPGMMRRGMMRKMAVQTLTTEEEQAVLAYLQQHALKPARPETLGPSDAPGLSLFKKTCSRCHALPDPSLHTAAEWPGVAERMRTNMKTMGKPVITDQERDEIVGYLSRRAR
jgi:cytochrome c5